MVTLCYTSMKTKLHLKNLTQIEFIKKWRQRVKRSSQSMTITRVMLPFLLAKFGADPAHAGTVVQVVMDITGVIVTVTICSMMLPSVSKKTRTPAFAAILERAFLAYFPENESGNVQKEHRSDADLVMTSGKGSV